MPKLGLAAAVVTAALFAGLAGHDAEARAKRPTRTVRMTSADPDVPAAGRMRFQTHHDATFMSASFTHLTPNAMHTVHWGAAGQDVGQFVSDRLGRAKLRRVSVPAGLTGDDLDVSVVDENGDPVLTCDPDAMPAMHDAMGADHPDTGGMMDGGGMMGGASGTDHASHHDGSVQGGMMGDSGTSGGGMMGSGGTPGSGRMMKR